MTAVEPKPHQEPGRICSTEEASALSREEVLGAFAVSLVNGLSKAEAAHRLKIHGPNQCTGAAGPSPLTRLIAQFKSSVVVMLLVAAGISALTHEYIQMLGILAAVVINAVIGFFTEMQAYISLRSLEELSGPRARAIRDGQECELAAQDLVPGDILILTAGSRVPADLRLLESAGLSIDEATLTGESVPEHKSADDSSLNMAYQGTVVVAGRCRALVVATGSRTKLGELGKQMTELNFTTTPLEKNLDAMGGSLSVFTVIICVVLFGLGLLRHEEFLSMLQTSVTLAVAAIPEGLPVVATLALALGAQRMVKNHTLVRKLAAVETLGCTQVICTDKTGTLTENKMLVRDIALDGRTFTISGRGYVPSGSVKEDGKALDVKEEDVLLKLLTASALCNDASLEDHGGSEDWHVHGDPTEGALLVAARKVGLSQDALKASYPRLHELAFEVERKRMTTVHETEEGKVAYIKGSPEVILALSSNYLTGEGEKTLDADMRSWFSAKNQEFARGGKRALAVAMRTVPANLLGNECELENADGESNLAIENHLRYRHEIESIEQKLTLIGLVAMSDELKSGVKEAVETCKRAGIRLVMLTGDQAATAETIAREISILPPDSASGLVVSGAKLEKLNPEELSNTIGQACVLARVKPEMKLSIVCNLQANGNVVAMTGDGVNDAAALRQADIGVAMGRSGTALAREASDMVITDDDITTIVKAIELGRGIYENIACAISYLLTASLASVVAVALGVLVWANLCMNPLQLLWLNLIMHVFPGLGIVLQQTPEGIMLRRPRDSKEPLLSRYKIIQIVGRALIVAACAVIAAHIMEHLNVDAADTVVLDTLSLSLLLQSWSWLSVGRKINFSIVDCLKNWPMWLSTTIGVGLIAVVTYFPPLAQVMKTEALNQRELSLVIGGALVSFVLSALMGLVPDRLNRPANQ